MVNLLPKDLIYNFKNFEKGGGKSVVKKRSNDVEDCKGQNCKLVENLGTDKVYILSTPSNSGTQHTRTQHEHT